MVELGEFHASSRIGPRANTLNSASNLKKLRRRISNSPPSFILDLNGCIQLTKGTVARTCSTPPPHRTHGGALPAKIDHFAACAAEICRDLSGYGFSCGLTRVISQMSISLRRLRLSVAEQRPDKRKAHAARRCDTRIGMPQIMKSYVVEFRFGADATPWLLNIDKMFSRNAPADHIWIAALLRQRNQDLQCGRRRYDHLSTSHRVFWA